MTNPYGKSAADLKYGQEYFVKALLIGQAKTGKTTSAVTWPPHLRILVIDLDQGKEVLYGKKNINIVSIDEPSNSTPAYRS